MNGNLLFLLTLLFSLCALFYRSQGRASHSVTFSAVKETPTTLTVASAPLSAAQHRSAPLSASRCQTKVARAEMGEKKKTTKLKI